MEKIGDIILFWFLAILIAIVINFFATLVLCFSGIDPDISAFPVVGTLSTTLFFYFPLFILNIFYLKMKKNIPVKQIGNRVGLKIPSIKDVGLALIFIPLSLFVTFLFLYIFYTIPALSSRVTFPSFENFHLLSTIHIINIGFCAFVEEFMFRGVIQKSLEENMKIRNAILFASVLFSLFHLNLFYALSVFPLAILISVLYWVTDHNLTSTTIMHAIYNVIAISFV